MHHYENVCPRSQHSNLQGNEHETAEELAVSMTIADERHKRARASFIPLRTSSRQPLWKRASNMSRMVLLVATMSNAFRTSSGMTRSAGVSGDGAVCHQCEEVTFEGFCNSGDRIVL